jgi:uncharacterized membrane protein YczE
MKDAMNVVARLLIAGGLSDRHRRRLVRLSTGLALFGVSIAMMLAAGLGVDSWDVFHKGVVQRLGLSIGTVIVAISIGVLLLWIPLRERPGIGTVANAVVVGVVADLALRAIGAPQALPARVALLVGGIVANGAATGLYIGAGLGSGPRDGLMTGLAARTGWSIRIVRTGLEMTVVTFGVLLRGPIGVGTVAYALSIGPLTQFFLNRFAVTPLSHRLGRSEPAVGVCP